MSLDLEIDSTTTSKRLWRCLTYSKNQRKRILQMNSILQREMNANMLNINRNYDHNKALIEKIVTRQKETISRLQAKLRVFGEFKTVELMDKVKGADYEAALKKIIDDEIEKELKQNDSSSISQKQFRKFHEKAFIRMTESIEKFKKFDTRLVVTPVEQLTGKEIFTCFEKNRKYSRKAKLNLPYLMMNPLFNDKTNENDDANINFQSAVREFERLHESN